MRKDFFSLVMAMLATAGLSGQSQPLTLNGQKLNVVLIVSDDMGYETLDYNKAVNYHTPNIDALAGESTVFTNCDAQPLCVPSRVKLITGQYNYRNYINWGSFNLEMPALGSMMRNAGYATGAFGKWHLSRSPEELGFDDYSLFDGSPGNLSYAEFFNRYYYNSPLKEKSGDYIAAYAPDRFNQQLLRFIDDNKTKPFFIYYPMSLAHNPFEPTPDSKDPACRDWQQNFEDMVAYADKLIGRVIARLKQTGLYDNTVIIYTGDNGTKTLAHIMSDGTTIYGGKGTHTNDGCHVPLFIKYDGKNRLSEELVDFTDFYPTLAEIVGHDLKPLAKKVDGASLIQVLQNKPGRKKPYIFSTYFEPLSCYIRNAQYKLYYDGRLFDIKNDPRELKPYYVQNDGYQTAAARAVLRSALEDLLDETALSEYPAKQRLQKTFGPPTELKRKFMLGGFIFDSLQYTPRREKIRLDITDFLSSDAMDYNLRVARMYRSGNSGLIYANAAVNDVRILHDGKLKAVKNQGGLVLSTRRDYKRLKETGNPIISFEYNGDNSVVGLGSLSRNAAKKLQLEVDLDVYNPDNPWGDRIMLYFFLDRADN